MDSKGFDNDFNWFPKEFTKDLVRNLIDFDMDSKDMTLNSIDFQRGFEGFGENFGVVFIQNNVY